MRAASVWIAVVIGLLPVLAYGAGEPLPAGTAEPTAAVDAKAPVGSVDIGVEPGPVRIFTPAGGAACEVGAAESAPVCQDGKGCGSSAQCDGGTCFRHRCLC